MKSIVPKKNKFRIPKIGESSSSRKVLPDYKEEVYNKFEKKLTSSLHQEAVRQQVADVEQDDKPEITETKPDRGQRPAARQGRLGNE